jgi:hypothetical protein
MYIAKPRRIHVGQETKIPTKSRSITNQLRYLVTPFDFFAILGIKGEVRSSKFKKKL